jgi:hypothetical protein
MTDLFDWTPPPAQKYPEAPGFKERTTSKEAARKIKPRAPGLRDLCVAALTEAWPSGMTPDQCADVLGKTVLAIRPRFTELKLLGIIEASSRVAPNASGANARVYYLKHRPEGK